MKSKSKKGSSSGEHSPEIGIFSRFIPFFPSPKYPNTIKLSDTVVYEQIPVYKMTFPPSD